MADLTGSATPVPLDDHVTLVAPGLAGVAELSRGRLLGGAPGTPDRATAVLHEALDRAGMVQQLAVDVHAQAAQVTGVLDVRSAGGRAGLAVDVPAPEPGHGQVLLLSDEQGVLSWHYPRPADARLTGAAKPGIRSLFVVPREVATTTPAGRAEVASSRRALVKDVDGKAMAVLTFPLPKELAGETVKVIAGAWEKLRRPYRVRTFAAPSYAGAPGPHLEPAQWAVLSTGRALLFVHGTFSTSRTFGGIPRATMETLSERYGGRLIAFDHPTLSADPLDNARRLTDLVPRDLPGLDVDIVCHSRGGLVARVLAGEMGDDGVPPNLTVRRIIYVGTPNAGTALADPEHMGAFVDRYTALLNLLPPAPLTAVAETMDALLEVVKVIGVGALGDLPGLAAMDPDGGFLAALNQPGPRSAQHYGIAADFEPTGSLRNRSRTFDNVTDRIFGSRPNDGVVPTLGVGQVDGDPGFPIPEDRRFLFSATDGVWHCSYFGRPEVDDALLKWLPG
jgi:hypothetical protein